MFVCVCVSSRAYYRLRGEQVFPIGFGYKIKDCFDPIITGAFEDNDI